MEQIIQSILSRFQDSQNINKENIKNLQNIESSRINKENKYFENLKKYKIDKDFIINVYDKIQKVLISLCPKYQFNKRIIDIQTIGDAFLLFFHLIGLKKKSKQIQEFLLKNNTSIFYLIFKWLIEFQRLNFNKIIQDLQNQLQLEMNNNLSNAINNTINNCNFEILQPNKIQLQKQTVSRDYSSNSNLLQSNKILSREYSSKLNLIDQNYLNQSYNEQQKIQQQLICFKPIIKPQKFITERKSLKQKINTDAESQTQKSYSTSQTYDNIQLPKISPTSEEIKIKQFSLLQNQFGLLKQQQILQQNQEFTKNSIQKDQNRKIFLNYVKGISQVMKEFEFYDYQKQKYSLPFNLKPIDDLTCFKNLIINNFDIKQGISKFITNYKQKLKNQLIKNKSNQNFKNKIVQYSLSYREI